jgi:hypothetical protein
VKSRLHRGVAAALLALALAPVQSQVVPAARLGADARGQVRAFAQAHGIAGWPRPDGCNYDRPWGTSTLGAVLRVHVHEQAGQRFARGQNLLVNGLTCHVQIAHALEAWPADLPSGVYVVAARGQDEWARLPAGLRIVAVLRDPANSPGLAHSLATGLDAGEDP